MRPYVRIKLATPSPMFTGILRRAAESFPAWLVQIQNAPGVGKSSSGSHTASLNTVFCLGGTDICLRVWI